MTEMTTAEDQVQQVEEAGSAPGGAHAIRAGDNDGATISEMEFFGDVVETWREEADAREREKNQTTT